MHPLARSGPHADRDAAVTLSAPGIRYGTGASMFESVNVIGRGRVGTAIAARLEERGVDLRDDAELAIVCVPDTAIRDVVQGLTPEQPWVAHVSGATPLAAL